MTGESAVSRAGAANAQFTIPRVRGAVPRERLHDRLDAVRTTSSVVLISAPAGAGKTSVVSSWLSRAEVGSPAWATLRAADNDERVFWRTLATALAHVSAPVRRDLETLASELAGTGDGSPARLARLIGVTGQPRVLVLDNLHEVVRGSIHSRLLQLFAESSDILQTIITTRHDPPWPLHRMRLDGQVGVLRAKDLAFDADEAAAMFAQAAVTVSRREMELLLCRTEGWAAGLQLAALGISSAKDPARFIAEFSGDDESVADYLMREVFLRLTDDWQQFLQRVCVVDEVCGDLANALTDGVDGEARLAQLAQANTFVHCLGHGGQWYRLHQLLVDFVNGRLTDPALRRDLHRRAAEWFQSRDLPWLALRHAVAGHQWELASDLAVTHVLTLVMRSVPADLEALLAPLPPEVLLVHPGLAIGLGAARTIRGEVAGLEPLIDAARAQLPGLPPGARRRIELLLDVIEVGRSRAQGDLDRMLAASRRVPTEPAVLADLGLESWDALRTAMIGAVGGAELWLGDLGAAREHLSIAADAGTPGSLLLPRLNAQAHLALVEWACGSLDRAAKLAREAVAQFSLASLSLAPQCACAYLTLAAVAIDRDELDNVDHWLELAANSAFEPQVVLAHALIGARRNLRDGTFDRGFARIRDALDEVRDAPTPPTLVDWALVTEADLLRRAGDHLQARLVAARIAAPDRWLAVRQRVRIELDAGDAPADTPKSWPAPTNAREATEQAILRARCALAAGAPEHALALLEKALNTAAPQTMRLPFLQESPALIPLLTHRIERGTHEPQFAVDLSNRMAGTRGFGGTPESLPIVALTERETVMLRYLASALSNTEIAHATFVSVSTVKTHQRTIYRKLAVGGRRAAVTRARELGLV